VAKVTISFLGNLYYDTRTFNFYNSLDRAGNDVCFIGYDWLTTGFKTINEGKISVTKLKKGKFSLFFYGKFFSHQLKSSYKSNADIYLASDFFSLPALFLISKLRKKKIYYDSREIFTELPFHENKVFTKKIIKIVERLLIRKVDAVIVTGDMDSEFLKKLYNIDNIYIQRNLPSVNRTIKPVNLFKDFNIPEQSFIILYQGVVVKGRGIEIYLNTLKKMEGIYLVILGGGEQLDYYKQLSSDMKLNGRVIFAGKLKQDNILNYTAGAFAGLSIIDIISLNNYYAIPNKLFEYIVAGIPVVVNNLPQMKKIIDEYKVGAVMEECSETSLAEILNEWKNDMNSYNKLKENCNKAAGELNWEKEFVNIQQLF